MNRLRFAESHLGLNLGRRTFVKTGAAAALGGFVPGLCLSACEDTGTGALEPYDPSKSWWLQGNYAPVFDELEVADLEVRGAIPSALGGRYIRNGANPSRGQSPHWFLGDGMLHSVRLGDGRAMAYRNRWVRTAQLAGELGPPAGGRNASNVSLIQHGARLLSSGEVGLPFEILPEDLSTLGTYDFSGKLTQSFTAHPKIDPATGHLHFFGYWFFGEDLLLYHVADERGQVLSTQRIPVSKATMIHSFAITEQDVVFWEAPVLFDLAAAAAGEGAPFQWDPSYGARIGVMPLGGPVEELRWVEVDPFYVFHEVNAYREGDDIIVDVCWHPDMFNGSDLSGAQGGSVKRWSLNTAGQKLSYSEQLVSEALFELPSHDRRFSGRPYRHGWFAVTRDRPDTVEFAGTGHIDYQTGRVSQWDPGPTRHAGEPFFVPGDRDEAQGWLLSFVYDHVANESVLAILDAQDVSAGPLAEVLMPRRVPYGFHGLWVPD